LLILLQVLTFNNIELGGYLNPYIYVLFIILLPFETPAWLTMFLGFLLGMAIDIFSETLGIHIAATVFIAYIRPFVLSYFAPRDGYETGSFPRIYYYGLPWFLKYAIILVIAHHMVLFFLELFTFHDFFATLLRILLSTLFTTFLIVISQYFVFRK
jgi:hypothetical protein